MAIGQEVLTITLRRRDGRVAQVEVTSDRLVTASQVLRGKTVAQALTVLPLLFSLCGQAQRIAGERAVEAALGQEPDAGTEQRRQIILAVEAVQEVVTPMLMDWPQVTGETPDLPVIRHLRGACREAMKNPGQKTISAVLDGIVATGLACQVQDEADLWRWARDGGSIAARVLQYVREQGLEGFGAAVVRPMPALIASDLAPLLAADSDGRFRARPLWQGAPVETGPLARQWTHPVITALAPGGNAGMAARVAARVIDLQAQLGSLKMMANGFDKTAIVGALKEGGTTDLMAGTGLAEAARGLLAHHVQIVDGLVRDWRILAPTEWTFHPGGAVSQGVIGLVIDQALLQRVEFLAKVLDPCVACTVRVE